MWTHWRRWPGTLSAAHHHPRFVCTSCHHPPSSISIECAAITLGTWLSFIPLCALRCMSTLRAGVQVGKELWQPPVRCNMKKARAEHASEQWHAGGLASCCTWCVRTLHLLALVIGEVDIQGVRGSMHNLPGRAPLVVHALPVALRPLHLDGCDAAGAPHLLQSTVQRPELLALFLGSAPAAECMVTSYRQADQQHQEYCLS